MTQDRSLRNLVKAHWLSWALLVMAYATYGSFLHASDVPPYAWVLSCLLAACGAWMITLGWPKLRRVMLLGFQSDIGYFAMALSGASLAVIAVTQFQMFAYCAMLVAVSLLARVDNLIAGFRDVMAFCWLSGLALLGLALSWLPELLSQASG
ncbi:hypothetical protein IQ254_29300 [Nodosilinea sp. LEGE 07088]|uniref:hypothetical protein n=1 Tax=Nodosilinea sp. LEGE 07088 TaxID=2777968 RepID=UPI001881889A|nr:hypothetical protein [Nodosilinea sp. LEGE 07088]MBE9141249.1 hypothetical protein [Nodosilinea sp. LEGE 07088]